jgi:GAF domain-containing protein
MAMPDAGERLAQAEAERAAALLRIAAMIARDAPEALLFAAVAENVARCAGTQAGAVVRYLGDERGVVVGVWNDAGVRGFPVNAELDFDRTDSALGRVRLTGRPARVDSYEHSTSELSVQMRASDLRASVAAPVMHGEEVWGAIVASASGDERPPADSEQRAADFADLVSLAVANGEARKKAAASRRRLVDAADDARRRLERELHEGTQQHLLALTLKLRVARGRVDGSSELAHILDDALAEAAVANAALRELARGLYPISLSERGLPAALQALTARAGIPVSLRELPSRRFPRLAEATAYFVVADGLALARPDGNEVVVLVSDRGDRLLVELRTSGRPTADARLRGLADRVAAVGGHLHVGGLPDGGSVMRAEIPVH